MKFPGETPFGEPYSRRAQALRSELAKCQRPASARSSRWRAPLECEIYCGTGFRLGRAAHTAFTSRVPCRALVVASTEAASSLVSGKVACRLALAEFVKGIQLVKTQNLRRSPRDAWSTVLLEEAIHFAHEGVLEFGSRLITGGKVTANFAGLVIAGSMVSIARVGTGAGYLFRKGQLYSFFSAAELSASTATLGGLDQPQVALVSAKLKRGDKIILLSRELPPSLEEVLACYLESPRSWGYAELGQRLFGGEAGVEFSALLTLH